MSETEPLGTLEFKMFPDVPKHQLTHFPLKKERLPGHILPPRITRAMTLAPGKFDAAVAASAKAMASKRIPRTEQNPTVKQARASHMWKDWQQAMDKEISTLTDFGTYDQVRKKDVPRHCQILQSKMDLKLKFNALGEILKFKARLVALGNLEWASLRDTYAPTVNAKTINLLLALAAQEKMILYGLDITGAFLTADIDDDVYIQLPDGIAPKDADGNNQIWKLNKTLYGLNRAPKAFYDDLSKHLLTNGYNRSPLDPCLFHKTYPDGRKIIFCVHVDDFAIATSDMTLVDELKHILADKKYQLTESDNLENFLGIHIYQEGENLYLSQPGHIDKMVKEANIDHITTATNIPTFNDSDQDNSPLLPSNSKYPTLLGILIYVLRTRPDIAYAVNRLATRSSIATEKDLAAIQQVIAYLRTTRHLELVYDSKDSRQAKTVSGLHAWSDAANLTHRDSRSHSGICFSFGENSGAFHARSNKQSIATLSSTEAELHAACEATKDIVYFRALLDELGFHQATPTPLYVDNKSLITLAQQFSGNHKRCKHCLARINYMIEQVTRHVVKLEHIQGTTLQADLLTKPKARPGFEANRQLMLGPQRPHL